MKGDLRVFSDIEELKYYLDIYPQDYKCIIVDKMQEIVTRSMQLELTLEELQKYNGQNGNRMYVAVNGEIYDVTGSSKWKMGMHFGVKAGTDVSEYFNSCHKNDKMVLDKLDKVGVLIG